jgi:hypothetical protein
MENETLLFLKMHECAEGVDDDAIRDIENHATLERHRRMTSFTAPKM